MKRFAIPAGVVLAVVMLTTGASAQPPPTPRFAVIHLTFNHNKTLFPADCLGTVTLETIPSQNNDPVTWLIRNGNAENDDDVCMGIDRSQVSLHFKDDVMGVAVHKVLTATQIMHKGKMVWAIQGTVDKGIMKGNYRYQVFYKNMAAGPDPEVDVACDSCGGGGH